MILLRKNTLFRTGTYSTEAFNKFPFNREAAAKVKIIPCSHLKIIQSNHLEIIPVYFIDFLVFFQAAREVSMAKWGEWEDAMGLPDGWKV